MKRKAAPRLSLPGKRVSEAEPARTRCGACHMVEGWEKVRFNHDPTGFPLRGAHADVTCSGCHSQGLRQAGRRHLQRLPPRSSRQRVRPALRGVPRREELAPAVQRRRPPQHQLPARRPPRADPVQRMPRQHARPRVRAGGGALRRLPRGRLHAHEGAATSVDHAANNFSRDCQTCHNTFRFFPVTMRAARHLHADLVGLAPRRALPQAATRRCRRWRSPATCGTGTYHCTDCHSHACARSDLQHKTVLGYECADHEVLRMPQLRRR